MKVLFLDRNPFVNLGIMSISAYLKQNNHECDLLIENAEKDIIKEISKIKPDIIAFSCTTGMHTWAIETAAKIKKHLDIPILMGAHHPTFYPEVMDNDCIDMICIGEGEDATLELLNKLEKKEDTTRIKNLHVKKDGKVHKNPLGNLIENLDRLPYADRFLYKRYPFIMKQKNFRIITGRGCPYNCTFCFNKSIKEVYKDKGIYVRRRSINNVINELVLAKKQLKIKRVDFQDDTFVYDFKTWLEPFLDKYKKKVNLPFTCCVRANLVNEQLAKTLKKAGCHSSSREVETL